MTDVPETQIDVLPQENVFMKKYLSLRNKCEQLQQVIIILKCAWCGIQCQFDSTRSNFHYNFDFFFFKKELTSLFYFFTVI